MTESEHSTFSDRCVDLVTIHPVFRCDRTAVADARRDAAQMIFGGLLEPNKPSLFFTGLGVRHTISSLIN